ncbi:glycosyltransferase [Eudoraea chungangensis]|uniref:glycosyltransferase n=1 Tax=Eudoraea chungangensis TaxID=1481905 RepID=UPI0023ED5D63|nr:glycosyltransferase [Eudoraea chungangensis]
MVLFFSIIIPVFNRPEEIHELLESLTSLGYKEAFEILIIEDGSNMPAADVVQKFQKQLPVKYIAKNNTGPGDSRNFGMAKASGNYFILLDSDCLVPPNYLSVVANSLAQNYVDCFGGPDAAHSSFSQVQKAINYAMTSFITTGGIRGRKKAVNEFQPRSFNMGLSKKAFDISGGFGNIHPGEDPDLSLRLKKAGLGSKLIPEAIVFHKRRIDFSKFYLQVKKFGKVRPILNKWHPDSAKITYWFPTLFTLGFLLTSVGLLWNLDLAKAFLIFYLVYFLFIFFDSSKKNKSALVGLLAILATAIQFYGYGLGFLKSIILITFSKKPPRVLFPELFFENR